MDCMKRLEFCGSESCGISPRMVGFTCHDRPYLSFCQPQVPSWPPAESFSQNSSTSACVLQSTEKETASVNLKCGPPLSAMNSCPSSWKRTVITLPLGPGPPSP